MNFRTTVILLVLLVGALVFFFTAHRAGDDADTNQVAQTDPAEGERGRRLLDVAAADVARMVVRPGEGAPAGTKPLELTNAGGQWQLVRPISSPADSFEARNLVEAFADARSSGTIDLTDQNRGGTGLARPRYVVELTDTKGKTHKLTVGERSALGHLYVSADESGKTASLVTAGPLGERLAQKTDKLVAAVRDKQIVRGVTALDARQVEIDRGGKKLVLHRPGTDWRIVSPADVPADGTEVSDVLSTLTNLRADEFSDEATANSSGASFDSPRAVVTIATAAPATQPSATQQSATQPTTAPAGRRVTVVIGQAVDIEGDKSWVKVFDPAKPSEPPTVAKVSLAKASFEKLANASPLTLRDRRVFDVDPEHASELTISRETASGTQPAGQRTIRLTRRKENLELGPQMPKPAGGTGTGGATSGGAATQPTSPATQPAATQPAASLGASPLTAVLGLLQSEGTPPAAAAPAAASTATQLATPPATPATQPTGTQPAGTQPAAAAVPPPVPAVPPTPPTKWVIASAGDADADDAGISDLLFDLHPLRATRYLDKMPAATQPAGSATKPTAVTYVLTIAAVAPGGSATTHEVHITDPGGDAKPIGQYKDLIFELDRAILAKLDKDFTKKAGAPAMAPSSPPGGFSPGGLPPGFAPPP